MEIRKIQIKPEDEKRLRELLKIHEADIDSLSDEELDAAEEQTSQRLQNLLKNQNDSTVDKSVLRFRLPLKTGAMAFLAAAAVMLFVQMQGNDPEPNFANMVTKGNSEISDMTCFVSVVGEFVTVNQDNTQFEVQSGKDSHVKVDCPGAGDVVVHVGVWKEGMLHLERSNLDISKGLDLVVEGQELLNVTDLVEQKGSLQVLITKERLNKNDLSQEDREGLWLQALPLSIKPQD